MKLYICVIFIVLCNYVVWLTHGLPQDFEDPTLFFEYINFDKRHYGSLDINNCTKELINCWELIKMDYVCSERWYIFDSVCGVMYIECDENTGYKENQYLKLYEAFCRYT